MADHGLCRNERHRWPRHFGCVPTEAGKAKRKAERSIRKAEGSSGASREGLKIGYSFGIPIRPRRRRRATSFGPGRVPPICLIHASMAGRSCGKPRNLLRSTLRNPILGPFFGVRFMIFLKVIDCVGQCVVKAHVFEPIFLPEPTRLGQEIAMWTTMGGVVTGNIDVSHDTNVDQPDHEGEDLSLEAFEIDGDVSRAAQPDGVEP